MAQKKRPPAAPRSRQDSATYRMRVRSDMPHEQRMLARIYNSLRDAGKDHSVAERIATAKVNQYRRAQGLLVEDVGRGRWYPGKKPVRGYAARAEQLLAEGSIEAAEELFARAQLSAESSAKPRRSRKRRVRWNQ